MKLHILLLAVGSVAATALAGDSYSAGTAPAAGQTLGSWFLGASFGQLNDVGKGIDGNAFSTSGYYNARMGNLDFNMYNLQIGCDLQPLADGCGLAAYMEIGYLDGNVSLNATPAIPNALIRNNFGMDAEIIPITANVKVEKVFFGPVSGYLSAGLGYAWTDYSGESLYVSSGGGGFYAQASAGLIYNINQQWELFGGARWLYLNGLGGANIGLYNPAELKLQDSWAWEAGLRFNF